MWTVISGPMPNETSQDTLAEVWCRNGSDCHLIANGDLKQLPKSQRIRFSSDQCPFCRNLPNVVEEQISPPGGQILAENVVHSES